MNSCVISENKKLSNQFSVHFWIQQVSSFLIANLIWLGS